ncbi:hypothetical protein QYM36_007314, partial [Artemia franciscana]
YSKMTGDLKVLTEDKQQSGTSYKAGLRQANNFGKDVHVVDMRSDTITRPSPEMRRAMAEAEVGDDVYAEDPTVLKLQKRVTEITGMEDSLFVSSGTMGNLIAVLAHCWERGSEIIIGDLSHIIKYEQGGASQFGGICLRTVKNKDDGTFDIEEMLSKVRDPVDIHNPITRLICIENTHNVCGGRVLPLEWIDQVVAVSTQRNIPVHVDGARLMNAAVHLNVPPSRLLRGCASVSICLSKGLGAPVGSVLSGSKTFIQRALRLRKSLGGGMRQVGILAAAGLLAVNNMVDRLADDHLHAKMIGEAINSMNSENMQVDMSALESNILMVETKRPLTPEDVAARLSQITEKESEELKEKIVVRCFGMTRTRMRITTHADLSRKDIEAAIRKLKYIIAEYDSVA